MSRFGPVGAGLQRRKASLVAERTSQPSHSLRTLLGLHDAGHPLDRSCRPPGRTGLDPYVC